MRTILFSVAMIALAGGCAGNGGGTAERVRQNGYADAVASSLVFQPPISNGATPLFLDREERQDAAFVGYDDITASYFYIYTDDRQNSDWGDLYSRRAVSYRVGASYR